MCFINLCVLLGFLFIFTQISDLLIVFIGFVLHYILCLLAHVCSLCSLFHVHCSVSVRFYFLCTSQEIGVCFCGAHYVSESTVWDAGWLQGECSVLMKR